MFFCDLTLAQEYWHGVCRSLGWTIKVYLKSPIERVWYRSHSFGQTERIEDSIMSVPKKRVNGLPKKNYWHLYSLQNLEGDKLAKIVNKILRKEYLLIK